MIVQSAKAITKSEPVSINIVSVVIVLLTFFILYRLFKLLQLYYASTFNKPLYNHFYFRLYKLPSNYLEILKKEHAYFEALSPKHKRYFEHRMAVFIKENKFIGKQGLVITAQMKVAVAATVTMLTFGFKKFKLDLINTVIIYPETYYSTINEVYHKGETNPQLKAIVFSWKDFLAGYKIGDDNLNLGIHEFGHAIHLNASINDDVSSIIFNRGFKALMDYLQSHVEVRKKLIASRYFRSYAYTNHYEFFAVLLENFIETPETFKAKFPVVYKYMKQMLNFRFASY